MATQEALEARLQEMEEVRDQLLMGQKVQSVGYDGKSVTYTPASLPMLTGRIQELKMQLGIAVRRAFPVRYS